MAKAKSVRKKKKTVKKPVEVLAKENSEPQPVELTDEQMNKLMDDIDAFQSRFLSILAATDKFEIIPTSDEYGNLLSQEQLALIKREANRLGLITIYTFDIGSRFTVLICPNKDRKLKIGMISNGVEIH